VKGGGVREFMVRPDLAPVGFGNVAELDARGERDSLTGRPLASSQPRHVQLGPGLPVHQRTGAGRMPAVQAGSGAPCWLRNRRGYISSSRLPRSARTRQLEMADSP
jgi:hypothetical protein